MEGKVTQGESLSGAFRWERDVLRLERAVLQQSHSRYEVQGEYTIPPTATIPRSAASLALAAPATASAAGGWGGGLPPAQPSPANADWNAASGRWRVQVLHSTGRSKTCASLRTQLLVQIQQAGCIHSCCHAVHPVLASFAHCLTQIRWTRGKAGPVLPVGV